MRLLLFDLHEQLVVNVDYCRALKLGLLHIHWIDQESDSDEQLVTVFQHYLTAWLGRNRSDEAAEVSRAAIATGLCRLKLVVEVCQLWVRANNVVKAKEFALQCLRAIDKKDQYMKALEKLILMLRRHGVQGTEILRFLDVGRLFREVIEPSLSDCPVNLD